jgi:polysaccharide deacetylase family protein (PEP-CTERM system associated)
MDRLVSFTLDFEDLRTDPSVQEERVVLVTDRILGKLRERGIRGTFFCVGELAEQHPSLMRRIVADGHELGVHGYQHIPNDLLGPERFRSDNEKAKAILSGIAGTEVVLYRAPQYSLVPSTPWIPEILTELGFIASSSVLPARSPLYGWPGAPTTPFRWPSGLIELPSPVTKLGPMTFPFLGGTYLRLLPSAIRKRGVRGSDPASVLWTYCHPWEFDPDEKFYVYEHGGWLVSRIGWLNRRGMLKRVLHALEPQAGLPLGEIVASLGDVPLFDPFGTDQQLASGQK